MQKVKYEWKQKAEHSENGFSAQSFGCSGKKNLFAEKVTTEAPHAFAAFKLSSVVSLQLFELSRV